MYTDTSTCNLKNRGGGGGGGGWSGLDYVMLLSQGVGSLLPLITEGGKNAGFACAKRDISNV